MVHHHHREVILTKRQENKSLQHDTKEKDEIVGYVPNNIKEDSITVGLE